MADDMHLLVGGGEMPKEEVFKWKAIDKPGRFALVPKGDLKIDKDYQRDRVSIPRVCGIAENWTWIACGVLLVFRRRDGSLWVYDGQHRLLAALKRASIKRLPCLIFETPEEDKAIEAKGFIVANTVRGPMATYHKYKAGLTAKDADCLAIRGIVEQSGYAISPSAKGQRSVGCIGALIAEYRRDSVGMQRIWCLCVRLASDRVIPEKMFLSLCHLERYLRAGSYGTVCEGAIGDAIIKAGYVRVIDAIDQRASEMCKGGAKIFADGIVRYVINHGKRTRRIPSQFQAE